MAQEVRTVQQYYNIYRDSVLSRAGELTDFNPGSIHDILAGANSIAINELAELVIYEFRKLWFETATGSDLEALALDRYGAKFARPAATKSTVTLNFSRPNTDLGDVTIPKGTSVSTKTDSDGNTIDFSTLKAVTMTGLTASVSAESDETGSNRNVGASKLTVLNTALTDSTVTVTNSSPSAGGADVENDSDYNVTIKSLLQSLTGGTKAAIKGVLEAIAEIQFVSLVEDEITVIEYDIATNTPKSGAKWFNFVRSIAYVADSEGQSSAGLLEKARNAVATAQACGPTIRIEGAVVLTMNWTATITLNPSGPNFAELTNDTARVEASMKEYIDQELAIGESFTRSDAEAYILKIWGSAGSDDITQFSTITPTGNINALGNNKLRASTIEIV